MADDDFPTAPAPNYFRWADGIRDWLARAQDPLSRPQDPRASALAQVMQAPIDFSAAPDASAGESYDPHDPMADWQELQRWRWNQVNGLGNAGPAPKVWPTPEGYDQAGVFGTLTDIPNLTPRDIGVTERMRWNEDHGVPWLNRFERAMSGTEGIGDRDGVGVADLLTGPLAPILSAQEKQTAGDEHGAWHDVAMGGAGLAAAPVLLGLGGRIASWLSQAATKEAPPLASELPWFASLHQRIFRPVPKPLRPFSADYPSGSQGDGVPLTQDIEGRPLTAPRVAGRRVTNGADEAIKPKEYNALSTDMMGRPARFRPIRQMGKYDGVTGYDRNTNLPIGIDLRLGLHPNTKAMTYAHELGHAIDQLAGHIPTDGLMDELKPLYNTLRNKYRDENFLDAADPRWIDPVTPQTFSYTEEEAPREYMAEAIRAYMTDPNYLKTVAPKTAAAIRAAVNPHPTLSKIIQFNVVPLTAGGAAASYALKPRDDSS
jgi:hypothetical protein